MLEIREAELECAYASLNQLLEQRQDRELVRNMQDHAEENSTDIGHSGLQYTQRQGERNHHDAQPPAHDKCKAAYRELLQRYRQEQSENEHLREEQDEILELREQLEKSENRRGELEEMLRDITEVTERGMLYGYGRYGARNRAGGRERPVQVAHFPQLPFI